MKTPDFSPFLRLVFPCLLAAAPGIGNAQPTPRVWDGDTSTDFLTSSNWVSGGAPASGSYGEFGDASAAPNQPTLTVETIRSINGLNFTSAAGGWTLSQGGTAGFQIGGGSATSLFGIQTAGGTNTINVNIATGVTSGPAVRQNWSVGTGGTLVINGNLSGSSASSILEIGTAMTGLGTLRLNGTNSRVGSTELRAGTVEFGSNSGFGSGTTTVLGTTNGGVGVTFRAGDAARSVNNAITLEDGAVLTSGGNHNLTFNGVLSGAGSFTAGSSATTIFTDTNTYTGVTTINSGATLQLGNNSGSGSITQTGAGVVLNEGGTLIFNRSNDITFNTTNNALTGSGTFEKRGSGTLTMSANASTTFTGNVNVVSGRLNLNNLDALGGNANTGTWTIESGATLGINSTSRTRAGDIANNGTIEMINAGGTVSNGYTFSSTGTVTGNGSFLTTAAKNGTADFTFAGTVSPGSTSTAGTLTFGNGIALTAQFNASSDTVWNLTGTGNVAGTDYDRFVLNSNAAINIVSGADLTLTLGYAWDGSDAYWQMDRSYTLFSTSAVTGSFDLVNATYSDSFGSGVFTFDGQNLNYAFTAVPEPGTWALIGVGLVVILCVRRRKSLRSRSAGV